MAHFNSEQRGWYQTQEFSKSAALQILERKQKKYEAQIKPMESGGFIVQYRAYTDEQIKAQEKAKKSSKSKGA